MHKRTVENLARSLKQHKRKIHDGILLQSKNDSKYKEQNK